MSQEKTQVYLMPGMAANSSIFENIHLPRQDFETHRLEWFVPDDRMSLNAYAEKMARNIKHENPVLIGVSFGGILIQEMAKFLDTKKLVLVSSVKKTEELPRKMLFAKYTKAHKLLPTGLVNNVELLAKYAFGESVHKRLELYERYLSIRDKHYIDWSIDQIVNWNQVECPGNLVHIHGDKDAVFPISHIKDCISVKNGTHTMIIHRAKWFNEHLPTIIMQ
ncbi:alpha/beta hydrolase [Maribacter sp. TH_r10]|uniref:Alpha/beta hydrolase n=1 Tax=Maribacter luteus TaxID=2594478 RepID=A0A6I2MTX9_9FLAO|nr:MULTISPECIES: alpha/beta hydrolase [Maribacter]MDV7138523.1 alpha/beta hydrolase [Maribacter sp. TH_r10]MRX66105.1 alpha/beta hydrolase [Maribacter luteus]